MSAKVISMNIRDLLNKTAQSDPDDETVVLVIGNDSPPTAIRLAKDDAHVWSWRCDPDPGVTPLFEGESVVDIINIIKKVEQSSLTRCPVQGCRLGITPGALMCVPHFGNLSPAVRKNLRDTYRLGGISDELRNEVIQQAYTTTAAETSDSEVVSQQESIIAPGLLTVIQSEPFQGD